MSQEPVDKVSQLLRKGAKIGKDVTIDASAEISAKRIVIGDAVHIGPNTRIFARDLEVGTDVRIGANCKLRCNRISIGENSIIGDSNDIQPHALFAMGVTSHIGTQAHIRGREVIFGDEVFITDGLRVGGGGSNEPEALLTVGDRCTLHNNFINVAKPVTIGSDVGFSMDTILITHGYWQSVLEGYSATFAPITIHDWVILGMRVIVLPGVEIGEGTTVGAGAIVARSLPPNCIAVGAPAQAVKTDYPSRPSDEEQDAIVKQILHEYKEHLVYKGFDLKDFEEIQGGILLEVTKDNVQTNISYFRGPDFPTRAFAGSENVILTFNQDRRPRESVIMNLRTLEIAGELTPVVHDIRDFLRRHGIRFYGYGFFRSLPPQIALDLDRDVEN
ncbi:MAG: acyltransferase [Candidatus Thorarchaeota archaeon]